jgi:hypothetical protein
MRRRRTDRAPFGKRLFRKKASRVALRTVAVVRRHRTPSARSITSGRRCSTITSRPGGRMIDLLPFATASTRRTLTIAEGRRFGRCRRRRGRPGSRCGFTSASALPAVPRLPRSSQGSQERLASDVRTTTSNCIPPISRRSCSGNCQCAADTSLARRKASAQGRARLRCHASNPSVASEGRPHQEGSAFDREGPRPCSQRPRFTGTENTSMAALTGTEIDALRNLFARYGLPVSKNPWPGRVPRYGSLQEACSAGAGVAGAGAAEKQRQRNSRKLRHATLLPSLIAGTGPLLPGQTNEQHDTAPHHPVRQLPRH